MELFARTLARQSFCSPPTAWPSSNTHTHTHIFPVLASWTRFADHFTVWRRSRLADKLRAAPRPRKAEGGKDGANGQEVHVSAVSSDRDSGTVVGTEPDALEKQSSWRRRLNPLKSREIPRIPSERQPSREQSAGPLSKLLFSWLTPLIHVCAVLQLSFCPLLFSLPCSPFPHTARMIPWLGGHGADEAFVSSGSRIDPLLSGNAQLYLQCPRR